MRQTTPSAAHSLYNALITHFVEGPGMDSGFERFSGAKGARLSLEKSLGSLYSCFIRFLDA
jgi:hypothetical protein